MTPRCWPNCSGSGSASPPRCCPQRRCCPPLRCPPRHCPRPLPDVVAQVVLDAAECVPPGREQATLNVLVADGGTLCATAWGETLYVRSEPDGVLIASEPGDAAAGWEQVPDRSLVVATAGAVAVTPLAGTSSPAGPLSATQPPTSHPVPEEVS